MSHYDSKYIKFNTLYKFSYKNSFVTIDAFQQEMTQLTFLLNEVLRSESVKQNSNEIVII